MARALRRLLSATTTVLHLRTAPPALASLPRNRGRVRVAVHLHLGFGPLARKDAAVLRRFCAQPWKAQDAGKHIALVGEDRGAEPGEARGKNADKQAERSVAEQGRRPFRPQQIDRQAVRGHGVGCAWRTTGRWARRSQG